MIFLVYQILIAPGIPLHPCQTMSLGMYCVIMQDTYVAWDGLYPNFLNIVPRCRVPSRGRGEGLRYQWIQLIEHTIKDGSRDRV